MGVTAHRLLKSISVAQGVLIPEVIDAACYALLEILRKDPTTSVHVLARRFRAEDIIMPQVVL